MRDAFDADALIYAAANGLLRNSGASLIHRGAGIVEYELQLACAQARAC